MQRRPATPSLTCPTLRSLTATPSPRNSKPSVRQRVTEYGFILDDSEEFGCSPDGIIKDSDGNFEGGLEIKAPTDSNLIGYHRNNKSFISKYKHQVMGCMMVTGVKWFDLMAYSETIPHLIVRVDRDDEYIEKLAAEVQKAVDIIVNETENLK